MSLKGDLFKALADRLMTKLAFAEEGDTLPALKWVDKNKGQLKAWSSFGAIPLPAALISFPDADWSSAGNNDQTGILRIRVILLYEVYNEFYEGAPDQDDAIKCWEYDEQMYAALQGFEMAKVGKLERVKTTEEEDHDALVTFTQDYVTLVKDDGANTYREYELADPDLVVTHANPPVKRAPKVIFTSGFITGPLPPEETP